MKTGSEKAENMTILGGKHLVAKTHPRIAFRGRIDILEAEMIEAQALAAQSGEEEFCACLGEILDYLRAMMAAEVKETPLAPPFLFGMDAEELHRRSHNSEGGLPPLPSYTQGQLAARINLLRARVREAELLAIRVFGPRDDTGEAEKAEHKEREDIILGLNRLSSALWWLFCEYNRRSL